MNTTIDPSLIIPISPEIEFIVDYLSKLPIKVLSTIFSRCANALLNNDKIFNSKEYEQLIISIPKGPIQSVFTLICLIFQQSIFYQFSCDSPCSEFFSVTDSLSIPQTISNEMAKIWTSTGPLLISQATKKSSHFSGQHLEAINWELMLQLCSSKNSILNEPRAIFNLKTISPISDIEPPNSGSILFEATSSDLSELYHQFELIQERLDSFK